MHISPGEYWLYLQYMALAVVMVFAFAAVYLHCTPPAELRLIREEGNVACALSILCCGGWPPPWCRFCFILSRPVL